MKRASRQYGDLTPREAVASPWQEIHCDTIGNWEIELRASRRVQMLKFKALTIIDPATNLVEIFGLITKTAAEVAAKTENGWISRYPMPTRCVSDNGPEFQLEFQQMLARNRISHSTSSAHNPQGNSLIERIHQAIGLVL